ncbi:tetratricopeptide repeat protein [Bacillus sp. EB106-08-02-XG196]|uniref:tetratricopeptide repeat protein n=1 Tax=Bacillus sp. EB106-08-02-XG196 TaxID=2737049 RepID=UPI0015C4C36A|nr:tetratricopeptide repeat protein [Bacillus sp. EB106-08-02-XG196]NWQ42160.1 tetratricopeptide repeat protein [Bacillus sp. EB106-08-02-XG196]
MITKLKSLYDQREYYQALEIINQEILVLKSLRYSELKQELNRIKSAEEFQVLIRLTDHFLMYQYSSFIARYAYRRFPSVLTISWYCEELLDNGKLLEADELISAAIAENQEDIQGCEELERLYFCKIRCLLEMKLFKKAEEFLEKVKESSRPLHDKIGYVFMQTGNREKAEKYFQQGLNDFEKGRICYLLLADLKASNGQIEEALALIEQGEKLYPETPSFLLEKIRRYRDLGKMEEMLELIEELNERIAEHAYQKYFRHLTNFAYYQLGEFELIRNEDKGEKSLFIVKNEQGELIKLTIKPIIQKSNYCVPASLEMILTYFGKDITQDEIATHIFDFTGSKLSTTVDYLEENGYECRYFVGKKDLYQELLKKNIPILLSVDFEHSSHVQVMTGYDSVFDFYHIQDPNLLETMYLAADDLEKANASTSYMSIVCVPKERADEISFLSKEEDDYFRRLHDLGEKLEEDEEKYKETFLEFLKATIDVPYSPIYVIKHFSFEEYSDFILQCAEKLLQSYPNNDFMNLHVAQAYMRLQRMEQAREQLNHTARTTFSPLYHFLNGRIALYFDEMKEAIGYFRNSLQLDPDQYYTWSYLGLSYLFSNDVKKAEYFSSISMELAPKERFVTLNHAAVLIEKQEYAKARGIYDQLIREIPKDGHAWYERARLDQKLGKLRKALRGYLMAINLEDNIPFAVLAAADLYEYELEKPEKAEGILQLGINTAVSAQLLVRLGDFYREHEEIEKSRDCYQRCIDLFPDEGFSYIGLAEILASQENKEKAIEFLKAHAARFDKDSEYLINSGSMMAEWAIKEDNNQLVEVSLELIERGINHIHSNFNEAIEHYVKIAGETSFINRAIDFLKQKFTNNSKVIEFKCYEGTLFEEKQQFSQALDCYNTAIQVSKDSFPYYRLGEVYFKLGMYELAANAYLTSISIDPAIEPAYLRLAEIAAFKENHEEEAKHLLDLLEFAPLSVNIEYLVSILAEEKLRNLLGTLQALSNGKNEIWRLDAEAYVYGALGETQLEQEKVTAALKVKPDFSELLLHQAKIFIKAKKWKKARSILTLLLKNSPKNVEIYRTLIIYSAAANKWSRLPNFLTKLEGKSEDKSTRFLLAAEAGKQFILDMTWSGKEEGNAFGRFVTKLKNHTKQIYLFGSIIELYEMAIRLDKNNLSAVSHFAKLYEEFELAEDAIKILQKALKKQWDERLAYQLGMNYLNEEDYFSALPLFERQLNNDREDSHLRYLVALCHCEMGETRVAEEMMMRIIEENPFEQDVYLRLGRLLNEQGRHLGAEDVLEKGMEYHPYDDDIKEELLLTKKQLEKSIVLTN